jgi:hypothetical protein
MPRISIDELRELIPFLTEEDVAPLRRFLYNNPSIEDAVQQSMRAPNLREVMQETPLRVLVQGADVNAIEGGEEVFAGPSRATVVDFLGATGYRDNYDRNIARINVGAGADCMFDYLVSSCFALLANFTEGQTFRSRSGCTFKGFSTVQGAVDDWEASSPTRAGVFFICGADYDEAAVIGDNTHELIIFGAGQDSVIIGGSSNVGLRVGNSDVWLHNLTLTGPTGGWCHGSVASGDTTEVHCHQVVFRRKMGGGHTGSEFFDCTWEAGWEFETWGASVNDVTQHVTIEGGRVTAGNLDFTAASTHTGWRVYGLQMQSSSSQMLLGGVTSMADCDFDMIWRTAAAGSTTCVTFSTGAMAGITLRGRLPSPPSGGTVIDVATGVTVVNARIHATFDGPPAGGTAGTRFMKTTGTGVVLASTIDCTFRRNGSADFMEDLASGAYSIEGDFRQSVFILSPTTAEITFTGSSAGNVVVSGVVLGAPGPGVVTEPRRVIDADGDTSWDVEETADADTIVGTRAGSEVVRIDAAGMSYAAVPLYFFDATGGAFLIYAAAADANAVFALNAGLASLQFGAGGASALDIMLVRRSSTMVQIGSSSAAAVRDFSARQLHIGSAATAMTNAEASIELVNTNHAALLNVLTTTQRDAVTAVAGMICFNSTTGQYEYYDGAAWAEIGDVGLAAHIADTTDVHDASAISTTGMKQTVLLQGWTPTTTAGCGAGETSEVGSTTKHDIVGLPFDATTAEHAFLHHPMPDNWDGGTVTYSVWWFSKTGWVSSSSDGVAWTLKGTCYENGQAIDSVYGTGVAVTDTGTANNELNVTADSAALTLAGAEAGERQMVHWDIERTVGNAADDWAADVYLVAVVLEYGVTSLSS